MSSRLQPRRQRQQRQTLRQLIAFAIVCGALVASSRAAPANASPRAAAEQGANRVAHAPPNILILFSDDHRADSLGAYGATVCKTPSLDRLAERGLTFDRAYCMGSQNGAVCIPSRAMLMTGRSLFRTQETIGELATLPKHFSAAGYQTCCVGKWHNGAASLQAHFQRGDSVFLGGMHDPYSMPTKSFRQGGKLTDDPPSSRHASERFADAANAYLETRSPDKPFLLHVAFTAPHDPRTSPPEFRSNYVDAQMPLPKNFLPRHPFNNGEMLVRDEKLAPWPRTPENTRQQLADYFAMIEHLDAQIGRILKTLDELKLSENTIVVFAGDSGLAIGSHGLFGKQNIYEHSMRVPLILAGPGVPEGQRTAAMCYLFDLFPTLCDLAQIDKPTVIKPTVDKPPVNKPTQTQPGSIDGQSLAKILADPSAPHRESIFLAYKNCQRSLREQKHKLILYPRVGKQQLFDLAADPEETHDLATDPVYAEIKQALLAKLTAAQLEFADPHPLVVDNLDPLEIELK